MGQLMFLILVRAPSLHLRLPELSNIAMQLERGGFLVQNKFVWKDEKTIRISSSRDGEVGM